MPERSTETREAVEYVRDHVRVRPQVAIVLGSGLLGSLGFLGKAEVLPYEDIPHYPVPGVPGHPGRLILGEWRGVAVAMLAGRLHYYEGYEMHQVVFPVRLLAALGVKTLVVTNAAGGLNPRFRPGDLMLITDHINLPGLAGLSPLRGPHDPLLGPLFVALDDAYCPDLRARALAVSKRADVTLRQGVYAMVAGPNYETPAERRLLRRLGADAVGMSTVPEVLAARQGGMKVIGFSCITNVIAAERPPSHEDVLAVARQVDGQLSRLLDELIPALG